MKPFLLLVVFLTATYCFGQGNIFTARKSAYQQQTFDTWHYDYHSDNDTSGGQIGEIIFWRERLIDNATNQYWIPVISFKVFHKLSPQLIQGADSVKSNSTCDSINKGGEIWTWGQYVLVNRTNCVSCSVNQKVDYCRTIIRKLLADAEDKSIDDFRKLLKKLSIVSRKYKP